jgi:hypothetical protein
MDAKLPAKLSAKTPTWQLTPVKSIREIALDFASQRFASSLLLLRGRIYDDTALTF